MNGLWKGCGKLSIPVENTFALKTLNAVRTARRLNSSDVTLASPYNLCDTQGVMRYSLPDGFPITFGLNDAARIVEIPASRLRTYIHRDFLNHVGQIPLAGSERRFTASGLVEIALFSEFLAMGIENAKKLTDQIIGTAYAFAYLHRRQADPNSFSETISLDPKAEISQHMDNHPDDWLHLEPWNHRDLNKPKLLVFAADGMSALAPVVADGYGDIEAARLKMLARWAEGSFPKTMKPTGERLVELAERSWPLTHILNVTALMTQVDQGIREAVRSRQPWRPEEAAAVGIADTQEPSGNELGGGLEGPDED